jgi:hypothetical protein
VLLFSSKTIRVMFGKGKAASSWPPTAKTRLRTRVSPCGEDEVALGQVFLRVLRVSPVNVTALSFFILILSPGG